MFARPALDNVGATNESLILWISQDSADDSPQGVKVPLVQRMGDSRKIKMLYYTLVFLIIAILAGAFGFFGVAGLATSIAKVLFLLFLILFIISLLKGKR